jgi:hypothetical protein
MTPRINWKPSSRELRKFGWTILIGFGLIGALLFWNGKHSIAGGMWAGAAFVCTLAQVAPVLARPFYLLWMGFGFVVGSIMSRVILCIIFFFVVTPVALFFKITGRDALLRKKQKTESYWQEHPKISDPSYYEHLS